MTKRKGHPRYVLGRRLAKIVVGRLNQKMNKAFLHIPLLIGILISLSSCNGQNNAQSPKKISRVNVMGSQVSVLDPSIWVIYQDEKLNYWYGSKY